MGLEKRRNFEIMTVKHIKDEQGNPGVFISIADWEAMQKHLHEDCEEDDKGGDFYEGFRQSIREIVSHLKGEIKLKRARDFLNEL